MGTNERPMMRPFLALPVSLTHHYASLTQTSFLPFLSLSLSLCRWVGLLSLYTCLAPPLTSSPYQPCPSLPSLILWQTWLIMTFWRLPTAFTNSSVPPPEWSPGTPCSPVAHPLHPRQVHTATAATLYVAIRTTAWGHSPLMRWGPTGDGRDKRREKVGEAGVHVKSGLAV